MESFSHQQPPTGSCGALSLTVTVQKFILKKKLFFKIY